MGALFRKEISQFFSSVTGYLSVGLFFMACGLILFVFPETSILQDGYATLDRFFQETPWIFLFLLPALTMRLFAEEWKGGTMDILVTRPLRNWQIVGAKYLAALGLLLFALLPTGCYYLTVRMLAANAADIDTGSIWGSYLGLFLLGGVFTAIGSWASSVTRHAVVAFLVAVFTSFLFYTGFDALGRLPAFAGNLDYYLPLVGIRYHYQSVSRGVIDLRDLVYFISVTVLFLAMTRLSLQRRKWQ